MSISHVAVDLGLRDQSGDAIDDDNVHCAAADQVLAYFEGLLGAVGLGYEQVVEVHAAPDTVAWVQGVLGVYVRRGAVPFSAPLP